MANRTSGFGAAAFSNAGTPASFDIASNADVIRTSAGTIAPGQTIQTYSTGGALAVNTTTTMRTVTTGKTWYITDICFTANAAGATLVQIKAGGTVYFEAYVALNSPVSFAGIESQDGIPSASVVQIVASAGGTNFTAKVSGIEQ